jgi:hypothetical protein
MFGVDHRAAWLGRAGWVAFALAAATLAVVVRRRGGLAPSQAPIAAALLCLGILGVPHANPHDALVIAPAFALALLAVGAEGRDRTRRVSVVVLALLWPLVSNAAVLTDQHGAFAHLPVAFMAMLAAVSVWTAWSHRAAPTAPTPEPVALPVG